MRIVDGGGLGCPRCALMGGLPAPNLAMPGELDQIHSFGLMIDDNQVYYQGAREVAILA